MDRSVGPEPRNASVGKNVELQVTPDPGRREFEKIALIACQRRVRQQLGPLCTLIRLTRSEAGLDRRIGRGVAGKVPRVDFKQRERARSRQLYDAIIVALIAAPARLPAI